ncbi:hypothetical protein EHI_058100 [Entamoeba histolytica HM-1:IMSS]|uniref:Uncharacterized protein n=6 Tax=Entamoeba histolytica TaxID=5759 RepID=C4M8B1_ENTH1|nr:hypothetical protein EHI_058100 [Entamoeba histolytica HM-1:IMSS]EAL45778.1 hypothetical protein EHI_058100 [Entamoeba histolytica HM-1:IMSS]EMD46415.1 Hypothetical protein EHI5A_074970 [Entamoeba histolytica KU27]ENY59984.1 hypothetical protein EHI7A_045420 [Entamoeba histolytica HM-1:IMSS-A]|eukprot:XP_651164.1 hypothetical protein EHI_058100 [Entamoeba histolytica HM-1:IMSS]
MGKESFIFTDGKMNDGWHIDTEYLSPTLVFINDTSYYKGNIKKNVQFINEKPINTQLKTIQFVLYYESTNTSEIPIIITVKGNTLKTGRRTHTSQIKVIPNTENNVVVPITSSSIQNITISVNEDVAKGDFVAYVGDVKLSDSTTFVPVRLAETSLSTQSDNDQLIIFNPIEWKCDNGISGMLVLTIFTILMVLL